MFQRNLLKSFVTKKSFSSSSLKLPFKIGKLNHVAIAVPDLKQSSEFYRDVMGAKVSEALDQPDHGVTVVFVELENTKFELLVRFNTKSRLNLKKKIVSSWF